MHPDDTRERPSQRLVRLLSHPHFSEALVLLLALGFIVRLVVAPDQTG